MAVKIVIGAGSIGIGSPYAHFNTVEKVEQLFALLRKEGVEQIDTASGYPPEAAGTSEELLGQADAASKFIIDSKVLSFTAGSHALDKLTECVSLTLDRLHTKQTNIEYLHAPDRSIPLAEVAKSMDTLFKQGHFKKLGISNYTPEEVDELVSICKKNDYVLPTVYQGQYNAINAHRAEKYLVPILKKHKIAYYAYSPTAGGFFGKHVQAKTDNLPKNGRFSMEGGVSTMYRDAYMKPSIFQALESLQEVGDKHGLDGIEIALRWACFHSQLGQITNEDAVILGASKLEQFEANIKSIKRGPLPDELVTLIDRIKDDIGEDAPWAWFKGKL